jgi:hypothetical protein
MAKVAAPIPAAALALKKVGNTGNVEPIELQSTLKKHGAMI